MAMALQEVLAGLRGTRKTRQILWDDRARIGRDSVRTREVSTPAYFWLILVFGEALGKVPGLICSSQAGSRPLGVV